MLKKIVIGIAAFVLVFGAGIFIGTKIKFNSMVPAGQADTFQAGWDFAKMRLKEQGFSGFSAGIEIKDISGSVQNISDNSIVIKTIFAGDLLLDPYLDLRTVRISNDTKIFQLIQKDNQQFQQEMSDFQKKIQKQSSGIQSEIPPEPYNKKEITIADIKAGQNINVKANENILRQQEFEATEILVQFMPAAPASL